MTDKPIFAVDPSLVTEGQSRQYSREEMAKFLETETQRFKDFWKNKPLEARQVDPTKSGWQDCFRLWLGSLRPSVSEIPEQLPLGSSFPPPLTALFRLGSRALEAMLSLYRASLRILFGRSHNSLSVDGCDPTSVTEGDVGASRAAGRSGHD